MKKDKITENADKATLQIELERKYEEFRKIKGVNHSQEEIENFARSETNAGALDCLGYTQEEIIEKLKWCFLGKQ